jgi:hypothetical protein
MSKVKVEAKESFETETYDVTDCCLKFCCFGSSTLILGQETVNLNSKGCCSHTQTEVPYGEVGNVNQTNSCGCCAALSGDFLPSAGEGVPTLSPGCGCEQDLVAEIVKELKRRVRLRGDGATRNLAEEQAKNIMILSEQVETMETKIDAIMKHLQVPKTAEMDRK